MKLDLRWYYNILCYVEAEIQQLKNENVIMNAENHDITRRNCELEKMVEAAKTIISEIEIASCCEGCRILKDLEKTVKVLNPCSSQENGISAK